MKYWQGNRFTHKDLKMKQKFQLKSVSKLIVLAVVVLSSELFAQEKIDYKQFRNKEWVQQLPEGMEGRFLSRTFTADTCFSIAKQNGMSVEIKSIYYLSDDWNGTFDAQKVGLLADGKYLIDKRESKPRKVILINVYEILKLTKTDLILRYAEDIELTMKGKLISRDERNSIISYKSR